MFHDYSIHDQKYKLARQRGDAGWGGELAHQRKANWEKTIQDLMADHGFDVTGIDISPTAIVWGEEKAKEEKSPLDFC
ncbi:class I SAM-dependent methyltransferase [Bdellovibrionota bacterium FG-2]